MNYSIISYICQCPTIYIFYILLKDSQSQMKASMFNSTLMIKCIQCNYQAIFFHAYVSANA